VGQPRFNASGAQVKPNGFAISTHGGKPFARMVPGIVHFVAAQQMIQKK
jgi:hypothetical protein